MYASLSPSLNVNFNQSSIVPGDVLHLRSRVAQKLKATQAAPKTGDTVRSVRSGSSFTMTSPVPDELALHKLVHVSTPDHVRHALGAEANDDAHTHTHRDLYVT